MSEKCGNVRIFGQSCVYADFCFVSQKDRYKALNTLAKELVQGNYYQKDAVQKK